MAYLCDSLHLLSPIGSFYSQCNFHFEWFLCSLIWTERKKKFPLIYVATMQFWHLCLLHCHAVNCHLGMFGKNYNKLYQLLKYLILLLWILENIINSSPSGVCLFDYSLVDKVLCSTTFDI